ncbi:Pentatricopeptide repeat-containing protein [Hibiscus syriacus]|uniref:Pentatricopeptide repeat-containing protein n=1 Tax=Hibiscus syriacus TaxID=106335 RepID=A0A6A2YY15_HIBSY|nr:Pentatricopeptide repeat-containing protein [Hibiscus syriacus]
MYSSCGSIEDAQRVFDGWTTNNAYSWNALLRGSVVLGGKRYLDVLSTFCEMRSLAVELNEHTFSSVLKSFAGASAYRQGLKAHALLFKYGFNNSSMLRTGLIGLYFKCGKIKLARSVFEEIPERDIVLWGAMIAGFAHNRMQREALDYARWMISEGIYPNSVILPTILPVIGEVWARKIGQETFSIVLKKGMTALMSGYISNGRLEQALRSVVWMQQEGFKSDVVTVSTILPICSRLRDLNHGMEIHAFAVKNCFFPNISVVTSLMIMYSKCGVLDYSLKLFNSLEARNVISWTVMIESYAESGCLYEAIDVFRSMQLSKHRPVLMARMFNICSELKAVKLGKEIHGQVLKKDFESIPFV